MSYATEHGLPITKICKEIGIEIAIVNDANTRIKLNQVDDFLEEAAHLTKKPLLGIKLGYCLGTGSCNLLQNFIDN